MAKLSVQQRTRGWHALQWWYMEGWGGGGVYWTVIHNTAWVDNKSVRNRWVHIYTTPPQSCVSNPTQRSNTLLSRIAWRNSYHV